MHNEVLERTDSEKYGVLVLGTMSSGKTAFINALIGRELLPSANEATTACIASIEHKPEEKNFSGACYSASGEKLAASELVSLPVVREWNANGNVSHIRLIGGFSVTEAWKAGLVLHDTPGPNNSIDEKHAQVLSTALRQFHYKMLCYVINAAQIGINDDRKLLGDLRKWLSKKPGVPVYFILNKVDLLDLEKGESIEECRESVRRYLEGAGFQNPVIIPTMAYTALVARKALAEEPMTRAQRVTLQQALDEVVSDISELGLKRWQYWLLRTASLLFPSWGQEIVTVKKLKKLEIISGLKAVESFIGDEFQKGATA